MSTAVAINVCYWCHNQSRKPTEEPLVQHIPCGRFYHSLCVLEMIKEDENCRAFTTSSSGTCNEPIKGNILLPEHDGSLENISTPLRSEFRRTFKRPWLSRCCNWVTVALTISTVIAGGCLVAVHADLPAHLDWVITGLGGTSSVATLFIAVRDECVRSRYYHNADDDHGDYVKV